MKYGCCAGHNDAQRLRLLAKLGFDYVECNFSALSDATADEITAFRALTEEIGLPCEAANVFFKGNIRLTGPEVDYSVIESYLAPAMEKARRAGISRVVFGSGGARKVPDGFPMDEAYGQLTDICRTIIAPLAQANGIVIAIEELNRGETNIVNTLADGMRIVGGAHHPHIALLIDLYHIALENDPLEQIPSLNGAIQHLHIANPYNKRYIPRSNDTERSLNLYRQFFTMLKMAGYDQRISIEAGTESDFETEAADALKLMKEMWKSI